jgi:enoyl-CoA hydratase
LTDFVTYEQSGPVAVLTMDDGKANAFGFGMMEALSAGLDRAAADAEAVVITGCPGVLCAGFDLKVIRGGPADVKKLVRAGADLLLKSYQHPQPVVIGCTGHAIAAGALLLLTADVRIGTEGGFMVGLNETAIGLALPAFGLELARDRLDPRRLNAATLGAQLFSPGDAVDVGYLDRAVAADDLDKIVSETMDGLLNLDRPAFAATKQMLRSATVAIIQASL